MQGPEEAIDVINRRFGKHPRTRALHATGTWCSGTFTATPEATALCSAAHLSGATVPVLARVSNGSGDPGNADYEFDVRGLAVSFELPDGSRTDLLAQTAPLFVSPTSDDFLDLVRANTGRSSAVRLPFYLLTNGKARGSLRENIPALRPVASYATARYFTVHAYRWTAADGSTCDARARWIPEAGEERIGPRDAKARGRDYLQQEIVQRLASGPARFRLEVQIAGPGDAVDDPSTEWPEERRRLDAGTLELNAIAPDPEADGGIFVFDPTRVTDGIELSGDQVLNFRAGAYSASVERRLS
jgi:catalase